MRLLIYDRNPRSSYVATVLVETDAEAHSYVHSGRIAATLCKLYDGDVLRCVWQLKDGFIVMTHIGKKYLTEG